MLTREKITNLRRFASVYASIDQRDTVLRYLSLIYIKYVAETGIGMAGGEDFSAYAKVMKCFSNAENFPEAEVRLIADRLSAKSGRDMHFLLLFFTQTTLSWLFMNVEYKELPGWNLSELEGDERKEELKDITTAVNILLSMYFGISRIGTAYNVVYDLASEILGVSKDDTFGDLVAGQGVSTFLITNGEAGKYVLSDATSYDAVLILAALYGLEGIEVLNKPLEESDYPALMVDKMFMDPPFGGVALSEKVVIDGVEVKETTSASILRMISCLNPNGIGIVTTAGKTLVGTTPALVEIKRRLMDQHLLKAVITLPPCWVGSGVKTSLLVISKEENDGVVFVDASVSKVTGYFGDSLTSPDGELLVPEIIRVLKEKAKTSISRFVPYDDIDGVNLTPIAYLGQPTTTDTASLQDIDKRLTHVYAEISEIARSMQS